MKNFFLPLCLIVIKAHWAFCFCEVNERNKPEFNDLHPIYSDNCFFSLDCKAPETQDTSTLFKDSVSSWQAFEESLQQQNQEYISSLGFFNYFSKT